MVRCLMFALATSVLMMAQPSNPATTAARPTRPTPPTRDPHSPGYVQAQGIA